MLINWQPVLGRGTSKTVNTPVKEQVLSQRLNMLLELQLEINLIFIFFATIHTPLRFAFFSYRATILQAWTPCFVACTCPFFFSVVEPWA